MANLSQNAMIVELSASQWGARKLEKSISADVARQHGSEESMGSFTKKLVDKEALKKIEFWALSARLYHYEQTSPWLDDGRRILASTRFIAYREKMAEFQRKFEDAVSEFIAEYPQVIERARKALNGLFDEADYPSVAKIRRKFSLEVAAAPIPSRDDFRMQLGGGMDPATVAAQMEALREAHDRRLEEMEQRIQVDIYKRICERVGYMVDRLRAYAVDPATGKVLSTFRDGLVNNLRELMDLVPSLDVTESGEIAALRERIVSDLCAIDASVLREDASMRETVAQKAAAILADVSDLMA